MELTETAQPLEDEPSSTFDITARIPNRAETGRDWHVLGVYETHFNLVSDEHSANDWYTWYMLRAKYDLTEHDQLGVRVEMLQRYIADPGESGLYFGDARFYYWRKLTLPLRGYTLPGVAAFYLTAPTSRESNARSYITRPTALVTLAPKYGPFTLLVSGTYRYSFARYAESEERSAPNERQTVGVDAQLLFQPVEWFSPSFTWQSYWAEQYTSLSWRGSNYYFEFAANFTLPLPEQWPGVDLSLSYAQGAPMLDEGVYRFAFAKRDQSELYLGLNLTY